MINNLTVWMLKGTTSHLGPKGKKGHKENKRNSLPYLSKAFPWKILCLFPLEFVLSEPLMRFWFTFQLFCLWFSFASTFTCVLPKPSYQNLVVLSTTSRLGSASKYKLIRFKTELETKQECVLAYIKNIMISSNPLGLFFRVVSDNYKPKSVEIFQFWWKMSRGGVQTSRQFLVRILDRQYVRTNGFWSTCLSICT